LPDLRDEWSSASEAVAYVGDMSLVAGMPPPPPPLGLEFLETDDHLSYPSSDEANDAGEAASAAKIPPTPSPLGLVFFETDDCLSCQRAADEALWGTPPAPPTPLSLQEVVTDDPFRPTPKAAHRQFHMEPSSANPVWAGSDAPPGLPLPPALALDKPGTYVTIAPNTSVDTAAPLASSSTIARLAAGTVVEVLEVVTMHEEKRVRAKIKQPEGWISLRHTENGHCWAWPQESPEDDGLFAAGPPGLGMLPSPPLLPL
jgi:hypothetical protein